MNPPLPSPDRHPDLVVHPLDDVPEAKRNTACLGRMPLTRTVRFWLFALRLYLVVMMILCVYHVLALASALPK